VADGDGWVQCALGHRHWGLFGAAGLLVVAPDAPWVLLQHRAPWSHGGDTWGVPGGARKRAETPQEAALRETVEETCLDVSVLDLHGQHVDDHETWSYTTFIASVPSRLPVVAERESVDLRWVAVDDVDALPLHPAFGAAWPMLRRLLP
jgi:8-oxo-dGTP pyrophosphatase MutT (NUDIX family)